MEIRNRLFPYPVLCIDNDDYEESLFYAECNIEENMSNLVLKFNIILENNEELRWLIREGYAEYVIHMECSTTAFRNVIRTCGNQNTYQIPKKRVNGEISLLAMIIATKNIVEYQSSHLNEDYEGETINFDRGAILAYYNMPKIYVTKNYEELVGDNAFFTIIKRNKVNEDEENPIVYDINEAKIKILVDEEVYDEYVKFHLNPNMEAMTGALLVMPALCYMIEVLRDENNLDKYKPLYWYQRINKACKLQGINFEEDYIFGDLTAIEISQQLLQLPINRAFVGLSRVIEE